jgi:acyl carrier protein
MDANSIIKQVNEIFVDVLDNEDIKLTPDTTATDVEDWDSLNHIQLVVAIEKHFKMRFTTAEINGWKNVGEMCNAIETRLKS